MQHSRDPLLEVIFDRINDLNEPVFIKNSELRFIAVNRAFCRVFDVTRQEALESRGFIAGFDELPYVADKECACLVFGEDQTVRYMDAESGSSYIVDMERFTLSDGQVFLFGHFRSQSATTVRHATDIPELPANMSEELRKPMNDILGMAELLSKTPLDRHQHEFLAIIRKSAQELMTSINNALGLSETAMPTSIIGARVLVVEENSELRERIVSEISAWGFECAGAPDVEIAISIVKAAAENGLSVDVIIIDDDLLGVSEWGLFQSLRRQPEFSTIRNVIMTSGEREISTVTFDKSVDASIAKPIRAPHLRTLLVDLVHAQRGRHLTHRAVPEPAYQEIAPPVETGRNVLGNYVLVAEDNVVNQIFFTQILESAGIPFHLVDDGNAALQSWQTARPAAILMDVTLPGIDGFAVTQQIRVIEASSGGRTPIIGVVNRGHDGDATRAISGGMDDFITKPITPEQVEEKLVQWCSRAFPIVHHQEYAR